MVRKMAKEFLFGQIKENMKECIRMICLRDKEFSFGNKIKNIIYSYLYN